MGSRTNSWDTKSELEVNFETGRLSMPARTLCPNTRPSFRIWCGRAFLLHKPSWPPPSQLYAHHPMTCDYKEGTTAARLGATRMRQRGQWVNTDTLLRLADETSAEPYLQPLQKSCIAFWSQLLPPMKKQQVCAGVMLL